LSNEFNHKEVLVLGAGPAGLTAAFVLENSGIKTKVIEADPNYVGGISRTVDNNGFKFDIGGHRFFTKSTIVQELWNQMLSKDRWLREVPRMSRIYYREKFFNYPLSASDALKKLGIIEALKCMLSYLRFRVRPIRDPKSFEEWVTNQFGRRLYQIFFKSYTEKVWGMKCAEISADWASQRIKGLSLGEAALNSLPRFILRFRNNGNTIRTLSDKFDYPINGPGELWESVKKKLEDKNSPIIMGEKVTKLFYSDTKITHLETTNYQGHEQLYFGSEVISSLPIRELVNALEPAPPDEILLAANSLNYRDFLTVVLIYKQPSIFFDNWIYIHEPNVKVGRIQNFKNWSKSMVPDTSFTSLGLEYFCFEGDQLWEMSDSDLITLGAKELNSIGLTDLQPLQGYVVRCKKAYPIYDDKYKTHVNLISEWISLNVRNLQLVGRNGMHMYNNQDHSMLTAYLAAKNLLGESHNLWNVNSSAEYHEETQTFEVLDRLIPRKIS
jgi:protoporphyrinogen oxidase